MKKCIKNFCELFQKIFNRIKKIYSKIDKNYLIIIMVSIVLMTPLFSYFYVNGHDTPFHLSNVYSIKDAIGNSNFKIPNQILPVIANGFGYGSGIFYPRLAHYILAYGSYFGGFFNIEITTIFKWFQFFTVSLAGICLYNLVKNITNNKKCALVSAIFYITCPYFISEFYVRSTVAESLIFVFAPLVLNGIYKLLYKDDIKSFYLCFILGYIGMINSHLITTVFFTFFILIFLLFNFKKTIKYLKYFIISTVIVLMSTSFFWVPILQHKILGDYSVFIENFMGNHDWAYGTALNVSDYFQIVFNEKNIGIAFYLNIILLSCCFISIVKRKEIISKIKSKRLYYSILLLTIIIFICSTKLLKWNEVPLFLTLIQFPWRLEIFVCLLVSIIAGFVVLTFDKTKMSIFIPIIIIGNIYFALHSIDYSRIGYVNINNIDISEIGQGSQREYLPTNTLNNIDYFKQRNHDIIIKNGESKITINYNNAPYLNAYVELESDEVILELPRLYYMGYNIDLIVDGKKEKINYYENENGFIEIKLNESGILEIKYIGTSLNQIANVVSIITIISGGILYYAFYIRKNKIKNRKNS